MRWNYLKSSAPRKALLWTSKPPQFIPPLFLAILAWATALWRWGCSTTCRSSERKDLRGAKMSGAIRNVPPWHIIEGRVLHMAPCGSIWLQNTEMKHTASPPALPREPEVAVWDWNRPWPLQNVHEILPIPFLEAGRLGKKADDDFAYAQSKPSVYASRTQVWRLPGLSSPSGQACFPSSPLLAGREWKCSKMISKKRVHRRGNENTRMNTSVCI